MELSVYERLILLNILPKEGDITTLRIVRTLRENLSFTESEHKVLCFKNPGETYIDNNGQERAVPIGQVVWNQAAAIPTDIAIGEKAFDIIVAALKRLNSERRLHESHLDLYERFVKE